MALQFGFVTLFSAAFSLAPLLAMINNLFEIRIDALKYTRLKTRPVPKRYCILQLVRPRLKIDFRLENIGIWFKIFRFMAILSVITNGLHLAFTTNIVPRLVWQYDHGTMEGYAESRFSKFEVSDFKDGVAPLPEIINDTPYENITSC